MTQPEKPEAPEIAPCTPKPEDYFEQMRRKTVTELANTLIDDGIPIETVAYVLGHMEARARFRKSMTEIAKNLIQVEPMPTGAAEIYYSKDEK